MAKKTQTQQQGVRLGQIINFALYDKRHLANMLRSKKFIDQLYNEVAQEAARIGLSTKFNDPEAPFNISDYPQAKKRIEKLIAEFVEQLQGRIESGDKEAWLLSAQKNKAMVEAITKGSDVPEEKLKEWTSPHTEALEAFQKRKLGNGMGLSERVWNLGEQTKQELELALDIGLGEGLSAADLSRRMRKYLNEPNKLFRRVRDKHGALRLSKAAQAYHPGRGVYRSSYKNALRLTATENNMAYHTADHIAWNKIDFVIGQRVQLSNNHTLNGHPFYDICDELQGDYPKEFKFSVWHPLCRCFVTPITADWNEQLKVMKMEMNGEDVSNYHYKGEVTEMPNSFTEWIERNEGRINAAKSKPIFIRENFVEGDVKKGYVWKANETLSIKERARIQHEARTQEQIDSIQTRWNKRLLENNGDGYNLTNIDRYINKYGVDSTEFDELMRKPLKYDKRTYEYPEFTSLYKKMQDLADTNENKATMIRGELFQYILEANKLGAMGKAYGAKIKKHIMQIENRDDAVAYWLSDKEAQQVENARHKIAEFKKHREDVLAAWQERKAAQNADIVSRIENAKTHDELAKIMKDARIAKDFDLRSMTLDDQKTIAKVAADMNQKWGLEPIDIRAMAFPKKSSGTFMWANGGKVEMNDAYWSEKTISRTMGKTFDDNVTAWRANHERYVKMYKEWIEEWKKEAAAATKDYQKRACEKLIKEYTKKIEDEQRMLDSGMRRHNVFLSPKKMLRDCFTHETGHTIHDQILGGINDSYYRKKMYNPADADVLNEELKKLYKKHKKLGGGWLSEYGLKDHKEFLSESFVLYNYRPDNLPADVKAWFDLFAEYSRTGKLPAKDRMPSVAFKPEKRKKSVVKNSTASDVEFKAVKERRKEIQQHKDEWIKKELDVNVFETKVYISNGIVKEWLNQPFIHYAEKNEMILDMENVLNNANYLGAGKDKHDAKVKAHLFETAVKGDKCWIIVREFPDGKIQLHSISDNESVVKNILNK